MACGTFLVDRQIDSATLADRNITCDPRWKLWLRAQAVWRGPCRPDSACSLARVLREAELGAVVGHESNPSYCPDSFYRFVAYPVSPIMMTRHFPDNVVFSVAIV